MSKTFLKKIKFFFKKVFYFRKKVLYLIYQIKTINHFKNRKMEIKFNNLHEFKTAMEAGKIEKPTFVSIRNYTNKNGETSNYLINLGTDFLNAKLEDIAFLQFVTPESFDMPEDIKPYAEQAHTALLESAIKNASEDVEEHTTMSRTQIELYDYIAPNVKIHKEKEIIYVTGMLVTKKVITEGEYPTRNSRPLTKAKNIIRRELRTGKYRQ